MFVTGSSGAGKSTLLHVIAGAVKPTSGKLFLNGSNARRLSPRAKAKKNVRIGFVPQSPHLTRLVTIKQNLEPFAHMHHNKNYTVNERLDKVLSLVGLVDVKDRYPAELSLGENKRVELARALLSSPTILVVDELTASLDEDTAWDIFHLLGELNYHGMTIVMSTHAKKLVDIFRKRVITLVNGKIVSDVKRGKYGQISL